MVVIHIKPNDTDQWLYETTTTESNDALIRALVEVWNLRLRIRRLVSAAKELAAHGPAKPEAEWGLDEVVEELDAEGGAGESKSDERGEWYAADPTGRRTGAAPSPDMADVISKTCEEALAAISKDKVRAKKSTTAAELNEVIAHVGGAVTMAFPMGLPDYDPVRIILEDDEDLSGKADSKEVLDADTATLWSCGKEFLRDQTVRDRVGRHERTKVIAKLQKPGGGAPAREPGISEDERKAMMAHYFKKQEEAKALAEADEEDYLNSAWADPRSLKRALVGGGRGIRWRA
eukprot:PLAT5708.1.p1 GENE.PLAT5708.1~~PLAT5708.1.p1  ORF type:complete len:290 (+),score=124.99 PLAT5708.1:135-1004(+)